MRIIIQKVQGIKLLTLLENVTTYLRKLEIELFIRHNKYASLTCDKFIIDCKLTLQEVSLSFPSTKVIEILVNECPKLKKLSIDLCENFTEMTNLKPNYNIETLNIEHNRICNDIFHRNENLAIIKFIRNFINLKNLSFASNLFNYEDSVKYELSLTNSKLERVCINGRNGSRCELKNLEFPLIKYLTIYRTIESLSEWLEIVRAFPNIEEISVKVEKDKKVCNFDNVFSIDPFEAFANNTWKSLKKISYQTILGQNIMFEMANLVKVLENNPNLKKVNIYEKWQHTNLLTFNDKGL